MSFTDPTQPIRVVLTIGETPQDAETAVQAEQWLIARGVQVLVLQHGQHDLVHPEVASPVRTVFQPALLVACQAEAPPSGLGLEVIQLQGADPVAHVLAAHPMLAASGQPRTILVSGYFGASNRGDDVILTSLLGELSNLPNTRLVLAAPDPATAVQAYGFPAIDRLDPATCNRWASIASAVLLGPGGLWDDYSIQTVGGFAGTISGAVRSPAHLVQLPLLVRGYGGRFLGVGLGAGPLRDKDSRAAVRLALELADSVTVRDPESRDLLLELLPSADTQISVAPDLAWAAATPAADSTPSWLPGRPYIAINLRPWENDETQHQIWDATMDLAVSRSMGIVAVPMQPVDATLMESFLRAADRSPVPASMMPPSASHAEFIMTLQSASALVAMRLHANLLAHALGTPSVGMVYHPKVASHFEEVGRGQFALPLNATPAQLQHQLSAALDDGLPAAHESVVAQLRHSAEAELQRISDALRNLLPQEPGHAYLGATPERTNAPVPATARVRGINLWQRDREVPVLSTARPDGRTTFGLAALRPRAGDTAEATFELIVSRASGFRIKVDLRTECVALPEMAGNIVCEVLIGSDVRYSSDVAVWSERTEVSLTGWSPTDVVTIRVRVRALRNLPDLGWESNSQVTVFAASVSPWEGPASLAASSNPMAITAPILSQPDTASAAPEATQNPPETARQGSKAKRERHIDQNTYHISHHSSVGRFLDAEEILSGYHVIHDGGLPIDMRVVDREARTTVVAFHGAAPPNVKLPFMPGQTVTADLAANCIFFSDPSLLLSDRLSLGWFAGSSSQRLQPAITAILQKYLEAFPDVDRLVFMGSSGGGFATLHYASQFRGSIALAINPQTSIARYVPAAVSRYAEIAFDITGRDPIGQLPVDITHDVVSTYAAPVDADVFYGQNLKDKFHLAGHASRFFRGLHPSNRVWYLGSNDWGEDHSPPPKQVMAHMLKALTSDDHIRAAEELGFRRASNNLNVNP